MSPYSLRGFFRFLLPAIVLGLACGRSKISSPPADESTAAHQDLQGQLKARGAELQLDRQGNIISLNLYWTDLTDDGLKILDGLNKLHTLFLPARATEAALKHLKGLPGLAELYPPSEITDSGLADLKSLSNLRELYLYGSRISDAGLLHLKELRNLEFLGIQHTEVTGSGLVHLQDLPKLAWLDLSYTKISDTELKHLRKYSHLKAIGLYGTRASLDGIRGLQGALPSCTVLYR